MTILHPALHHLLQQKNVQIKCYPTLHVMTDEYILKSNNLRTIKDPVSVVGIGIRRPLAKLSGTTLIRRYTDSILNSCLC